MYDDTPNFSVLPSANASTHKGAANPRGHVSPAYPCTQISTPLAIFLGGNDNLCDIPYLLEQTKQAAIYVECLDNYEHLSFLWADDVDTRVNPKVIELVGEAATQLGFDVEKDGKVAGLSPTLAGEEGDWMSDSHSMADSMDTASQGSLEDETRRGSLRFRSRHGSSPSIDRLYRRQNERRLLKSGRRSRRTSDLKLPTREEKENETGHVQTVTGEIAPCPVRERSVSKKHPSDINKSPTNLEKPLRETWPMNEKESKRHRALSSKRLRSASHSALSHPQHDQLSNEHE